jgi:hypothetical protein
MCASKAKHLLAKKNKINKNCLNCGKELPNNKSKYCNNSCKWKHLRGKNHKRYIRKSIVCEICKKEFFVRPYEIYTNNRKYCSRKCCNKGKEKGDYTKCLICSNEIYQSKSRKNRGNGKYCSNKCRILGSFGKKNPSWKGGISSFKKRITQSYKYKLWRQKILIRDEFKCKKCGSVDKLRVHHIKRFSKIIKDIKDYMPLLNLFDACMIYIPLWDINNGTTLCYNCHKKIHKGRT